MSFTSSLPEAGQMNRCGLLRLLRANFGVAATGEEAHCVTFENFESGVISCPGWHWAQE